MTWWQSLTKIFWLNAIKSWIARFFRLQHLSPSLFNYLYNTFRTLVGSILLVYETEHMHVFMAFIVTNILISPLTRLIWNWIFPNVNCASEIKTALSHALCLPHTFDNVCKKSFELLTLFDITFEDVCGKWIAHEVHGNKCQIFFCSEDVLFARFTW